MYTSFNTSHHAGIFTGKEKKNNNNSNNNKNIPGSLKFE